MRWRLNKLDWPYALGELIIVTVVDYTDAERIYSIISIFILSGSESVGDDAGQVQLDAFMHYLKDDHHA